MTYLPYPHIQHIPILHIIPSHQHLLMPLNKGGKKLIDNWCSFPVQVSQILIKIISKGVSLIIVNINIMCHNTEQSIKGIMPNSLQIIIFFISITDYGELISMSVLRWEDILPQSIGL